MSFSPLLWAKRIHFPSLVRKLQSFDFHLWFSAIATADTGALTAEAAEVEVDLVVPTSHVATV